MKKYIGDNMQDTIFKVKADLGSDAIILHTRRFKTGGFLGFFARKKVEVLAALEEKETGTGEERTLQEIDSLKKMIREMDNRNEKTEFFRNISTEMAALYSHLKQQGVDTRVNRQLLTDLGGPDKSDQESLRREAAVRIADFIGQPAPLETGEPGRVAAFVGPTGVGKTTTIAKLAARYGLDEGRKVALVTIDTYRIAAVQQLKTYSEIMDIPLRVAYNGQELQEIISQFRRDYDLILLDTAGSSWSDQLQLGRLQQIITGDLVDEVHLVISLNTKGSDIEKNIDSFAKFKPDKLLFTKLDETATFGELINIRASSSLPYSYITFGQDVPDDLMTAGPDRLAEYLLGDYYD